MKIILNAITSKLIAGGGFQVAVNFVKRSLEAKDIEWYYFVSTDVDGVLGDSFLNIKNSRYFVFPTQPDFRKSYYSVRKQLRVLEYKISPDVIYTITAPSYFTFKTTEVMRFTMPWVTHPNRYSWAVLSWKKRLKMKLYCWNQRRMMRKARYFVTQSETTRQGILRITGAQPENVRVVKNVLPSIFKTLDNTPFPADEKWIDIVSVANDSKHKNLDIIPSVLDELKRLGINNVRFHVTLPQDCSCWNDIQKGLASSGLEDRVVTHGRLSQSDLAIMYRHCQICFLPTLLEVFSASTLEAMYFNLPIVATDFDFNKEVMADACLYYEPMNAKKAAMQIKRYIEDESLRNEMKEKMAKQLTAFSDYDRHFNDILDFLMEVGNKEKGTEYV